MNQTPEDFKRMARNNQKRAQEFVIDGLMAVHDKGFGLLEPVKQWQQFERITNPADKVWLRDPDFLKKFDEGLAPIPQSAWWAGLLKYPRPVVVAYLSDYRRLLRAEEQKLGIEPMPDNMIPFPGQAQKPDGFSVIDNQPASESGGY